MNRKLFTLFSALCILPIYGDNGGIIESQDCQLGYRIEGTGPNALVIGSSIYYPRIISENLRSHLRLIFADMRAFAPPPRSDPPLNFDLNLILDDIEGMRRELNLGQIIVIGHSGNAFLALEYAKKYPEHVSHVVMIGTGPDFSDKSKEAADRYWLETASKERKAADQENFERCPNSQYEQIPSNRRFIWNYIRHGARIWHDFAFDSTPLWTGVNVNMTIFEYVWGTLFKEIDITKGLKEFDKPVFLALGRYDYIVAPPDSWEPLRSQFKDVSICVFEQSGHSPFYEEPELFDGKLLNWLHSR
ncbi:MAG: alpha/beta hydrolase [Verrucomicrobia bacterium]|nr:alpha/beta hydrolase [Verrucomicrobiota bacterium]